MKAKGIIGVIPARWQSSRFEGKPLAAIGDKTMIRMVCEQAQKSELLERIIVATDDQRIFEHVRSFGGEAVMTAADIATGTDRCFAVARELDCDITVNIQGDEPLIDPTVIDQCIRALLDAPEAVAATPVARTRDPEKIKSPHVVKVACDANMNALYFSRSPIPFNRNNAAGLEYLVHIGLYVYRTAFLEQFVKLEQTPLELAESLEQLRILENGHAIRCRAVKYDSLGVDTPEDLERVIEILGAGQ